MQENAGAQTEFVTRAGVRGSVVAGLTCVSAVPVLGGQVAFTILGVPGNVGEVKASAGIKRDETKA